MSSSKVDDIWVLAYGGGSTLGKPTDTFSHHGPIFSLVGIVIGLIVWGRRVISTLGSELTRRMSPSRGFCIELGASLAVLLATVLGFPVSSTHCKVGSVIIVGYVSHENGEIEQGTALEDQSSPKKEVNWRLALKILVSWIVTIPFSGLTTGALYVLLKGVVFSDA